jgi:hypothetical protein
MTDKRTRRAEPGFKRQIADQRRLYLRIEISEFLESSSAPAPLSHAMSQIDRILIKQGAEAVTHTQGQLTVATLQIALRPPFHPRRHKSPSVKGVPTPLSR